MKTKNILFTTTVCHSGLTLQSFCMRWRIKSAMTLLFAVVSTFSCFSQSWQWAQHGGSISTEDGTSICQDSDGNSYMVGRYEKVLVSASSGIFGADTVPYLGKSQIIIAKYSSTGDVIWAKSIGGNDNVTNYGEQSSKIYYDQSSNSIYLNGKFFGPIVLENDTLLGDGFFLTKMDVNGNFIWAKKLANTWSSSIATDNTGNVYICGSCTANTTFDTVNVVKGNFLAKLNSTGKCIKVNSNFINSTPGIISIRNGYLYIIGYIDNDTTLIDTLTSIFTNSKTTYISKFNLNLRMNWVRFMTSTNWPAAYSICTDSISNSYIAGNFRSNINFGVTSFTTTGFHDLFIAKYDSNGVFQWAKQGFSTTGALNNIFVTSLTNGDFYLAGDYYGSNLKLGNYMITSQGGFIARYNNIGNCSSLETLPGIGYLQGIATNSNNDFSIVGEFSNPVNIGTTNLTSYGYSDIFVAKHDMLTGEGLKMLNANNQLVIYANPNAGKCNITIPTEFKTETKLTLQIFDNNGHLLQQTPVEMMQDIISVNITAEAKGIYNAVLTNGVKSYTGKIIFE